ncbi:MAG TPA: Ig-like domain-containing protein, partial [Bdellovibrionales bacterium]|nr:Ig-like domain-containing protein [Bdellovibrionales bacterium]
MLSLLSLTSCGFVFENIADLAGNHDLLPTISEFKLADPATGSAILTNQTQVSTVISSDISDAFWCLSESQSAQPSSTAEPCNGGGGPENGWWTTRPSAAILSGGSGNKTVYLWVASRSGKVRPEPLTAQIELDQGLPSASITTNPPLQTASNAATFLFSGADNESGLLRLQCKLDNAAYSSCSSPLSFASLADGNHVLYVQAIDRAVNQSPAISYTWQVDTASPLVVLNSQPNNPTNDSAGTFVFSGNDGSGTGVTGFQCRVDAGVFGACASPLTLPVMADGSHTFYVKAVDAVANESTTLSYSWTIDTSLPVVNILTGPAATVNTSTASFTFSATDTGTGVAQIECSLDGGAYAACSSPKTYNGLADGSHTFDLRAVDGAGNVSLVASRGWSIDTSVPSVTVVIAPASPTNQVSQTVSGTCSDTGTGIQAGGVLICTKTSACSYPGDYLANVNCAAGSYTHNIALAQGTYDIKVVALDGAGNASAPAGTTGVSYVVDTTDPTVNLSGTPTNPSNDVNPSFTFSGTDVGGAGLAGFECELDGGGFTACSSPKAYTGLAAGAHSFSIRAVDGAGNVSGVTTYAWSIDTTAPTLVFSTPAANTPAQTGLAVTGTCETGLSVAFSGDVTAPASAACAAGNFSTTVTFTAGEGTKSVTVTQTDAAGNSGSATRAFIRDNTSPTVSITAQPSNPTSALNASFSFTAADDVLLAGTECELDGGGYAACTSAHNIAGPLAAGSHTFSVRSIDAAGNISAPASYTWSIDTTAPSIAITGPAAGTPAQTGLSVAGTCETGLTITFSGDITAPASAPCAAGAFNEAVTFTAGEGPKTVTVSQTDGAGNSASDSRAFVRDNTNPTASITAQPSNPTNATNASFSFTGADANGIASYQCELDGGGYAACTSAHNIAGPLAAGSHTFNVRSIDVAGNISAPATYTWTVDLTGPGAFTIAGYTGGSDATVDGYLVNLVPVVNWNASSDAVSYDVEVRDNSGTVNVCALTNTAGTSQDFTAICSLTDNTTYRAYVIARDSAGNTTAASNNGFTMSVDMTAPASTCGGVASFIAVNSATATPGCSDAAGGSGCAGTECRLDGGAFGASCTFGSLSEGAHTIAVRSTDLAGNVQGAGFGSCAFTVDTVIPTVSITGQPADPSNATGPSFTFTGNGTGTAVDHFECKLDAGAYAVCTSPHALAGLSDGSHTFYVKSFDQAGNGSLEASYTWTVNTAGPGAFNISGLTSGAAGGTDASANAYLAHGVPVVNWAAAVGASTYDVEIRDAAGSANVCALANTAGTTYDFNTVCTLTDGFYYKAYVTAVDAATNTRLAGNAPYDFLVDTTAPSSSCAGIAAFINSASATATPGCTDSSAGTASGCASTQCRLDGGSFQASCAYTGLADGAHSIAVKSYDNAGNEQTAGFGSCAFTVDTVIPTVSVTGQPANPTNAISATFTFSGDGTGSGIAGFECELDGGGFGACTSPHNIAGPLGAGAHSFRLRATDQAGNISNIVTYNWTVDVTDPNITIANPAMNTAGQTGLTIDGACEDGLTVALSGAGLSAPATTACSGSAYSVAITFTAGDGVKNIVVSQTDSAGNTGSANRNFIKDDTDPGVTITGAPAATTNLTSATFTFTGDDGTGSGVVSYQCELDNGGFSACVSGVNYPGPLSQAAHTFKVKAIDAAGNETTPAVSHAWTIVNNSSPVAVDDTANVDEGSAAGVVVSVLANDTDSDAGDTLTVSGKTDGTNGTVTIEAGNTTVKYVPNAGFNGVDTFTYTVSDGMGGTDTGTVTVKVLNPFTWDGGGGDANWTTGANWHGNVAPSNAQTAIFDATCSSNCSPMINAAIDVGGVAMKAGYAGTLTQAVGAAITVRSGGWIQAAGTFTGSGDPADDLAIQGDFELSGGSFGSPGGTMSLNRNFTRSGTATFASNYTVFRSAANATITAPGISFGPVEFQKPAGSTITISGTMSVSAGLTLFNTFGASIDGGTIEIAGGLGASCTGAAGGGTGTLKFVGASNRTLTGASTCYLPNFELATTGGTATLSGTLNVQGSWTESATGTIASGTSTVSLGGSGNATVSRTNMSFNNLSVNKTGTAITTISGTVPVAGTLTIAHAAGATLNGGTLSVAGDLVHSSGGGGSAALTLNGGAAQTVTHSGGTIPAGTFTIDKSAGAATLATALTLSSAGQDLVVQSGTLNLDGFNLTVNDAISVAAGATLMLQGSETVTRGSIAFATSSEAYYTGNGSGNYTGLRLGNTYANLSIAAFGSAFTLDAPVTVGGGFTLANGTLNAAGHTMSVGSWHKYAPAIFNHDNNTVAIILDGGSPGIRGSTTFNNLTFAATENSNLYFEAGETQTIAGTLTLTAAAGKILSLRSLTNGTQWRIDPQGSRTLARVDVKDSNNINAALLWAGAGSADSGNNTNWDFSTAAPAAPLIAGLRGGADATDDAWLANTTPTLVWSAAAGALSYDVAIKNTDGSSVHANCDSKSTAALSYNFAGCTLTDGQQYRAYVTARNGAGTTAASNDAYLFTVDVTAPAPTFLTPAANSYGQTTLAITGNCEGTLTVSLTGTGLSSPASTACASGSFSETITFTAGDGTKNIVISQTDAAGNSGSSNRDFIRDDTDPGTVGALDDGTTSISTTASNTITWTAASDGTGSGISHYLVAIGTSAGGTQTLGWTNVGNVLSYQATGLTLTLGNTYYASVKAVDLAGNEGTAALGDGWQVVANSNPVAVADTLTVDQDAAAGVTANVVSNDTDVDPGATITITGAANGSNGTVTVQPGNTSVKYVPNAGFNGLDTFTYDISDGQGGSAQGTVTVKVMNPFTWTGAAAAGATQTYWSNNANWHGGTAPTNADVAIFDGTCSSNCSPTIDASINVAGVKLGSSYTGTITQAAGQTITVGASGWKQSAGTFTGGNSAMTISVGEFHLDGGTFTSTTGDSLVRAPATSVGFRVGASATFNHNNGKWIFLVESSNVRWDVDVNVSATFNQLEYRGTDGNFAMGCIRVLGADRLIVLDDFTIGRNDPLPGGVCAEGGTIEIAGDVIVREGALARSDSLNATIVLNGAGAQTYTSPSLGTSLASLKVDKASGAVTPAAGTTNLRLGFFELAQGSFTAPSGTLELASLDAANFTFKQAAGTTFSHNNGTVRFDAMVGNLGYTIDVPGTGSFYDVVFGMTTSDAVGRFFTIGAGDTIAAARNLTIQRTSGAGTSGLVIDNGTLTAGGNLTIGTGAAGGTAAITLNGTGNQSISQAAGTTVPSGTFTINKASGTALLASSLTLNSAGQDLSVAAGTLDLSGYNITVNDAITVAGTVFATGAETVSRASITFLAGSQAYYNGTGVYADLNLGHNYQRLRFDPVGGASGTWSQTADLTVASELHIDSNTTVNSQNFNLSVGGNLDIRSNPGYAAGTGTVTFTGNNQRIMGDVTFYNFVMQEAGGMLTIDGGRTVTVTNAFTLEGASGNLLTLRSSSAGTQFNINPQGSRTIAYLNVRDSNNTNALRIQAFGTGSTDSGNNTNWNFAANNAPVAVADTYIVNQDSAATSFAVRSNDTDANLDPLTITTVSNPPGGTATIVGGATIDYTPDAGFNGVDTFTYDISDGNGGTAQGTVTVKVMNPFTWTGGAFGFPGQLNWSNNANWHGGTAPTNADVAIFDATCSSNCSPTINASINVAGVRMNSGYNGTITQAAGQTITVGATGWLQAAGTFTGGNSNITVAGPWSLSGGSYTSTSANLTIERDLTVTNAPTFAHNSGTVTIGSIATAAVTPGSLTFNHFAFTKGGGAYNNLSGTLKVDGNLTINQGAYIVGGTIELKGNLTATANNPASPLTLVKFIGTAPQTWSGSAPFGSVEIASSGGVTLSGTVSVDGHFTHTSGTVTTTGSTIQFMGPPSATVNAGTTVFNDIAFQKGGGSTLTIQGSLIAGANATINNTGGLLDGGTLEVRGNLTVTANNGGGATAITMNGTGAQTITHSGGTMPGGTFTINKASGTATLASALTLNAPGQDLAIASASKLDLAGYNLTVNDAINLANTATFAAMGGETVTRTSLTWGSSGNVAEYYGTGTYNALPFGYSGYRWLDFKGSGTFNLPSNVSAFGLSMYNTVTLNAGTVTVTLTGGLYREAGTTLSAGTSTFVFSPTGIRSVNTSNTFYNLTILPSSGGGIQFAAGTTQTITNAFTVTGSAGNLAVLQSATAG